MVLGSIYKMEVSDNGKGIKKEDLPNLFKEFGKIEDVENLNPKGVGLGLLISYRLSLALSGIYRSALQVESIYEQYPCFVFFIENFSDALKSSD
jgi:K+-sensing histidine kinase KdpD